MQESEYRFAGLAPDDGGYSSYGRYLILFFALALAVIVAWKVGTGQLVVSGASSFGVAFVGLATVMVGLLTFYGFTAFPANAIALQVGASGIRAVYRDRRSWSMRWESPPERITVLRIDYADPKRYKLKVSRFRQTYISEEAFLGLSALLRARSWVVSESHVAPNLSKFDIAPPPGSR